MSLYGFSLFVHIVFAIALVGGSIWMHVSTGLVKRARTVEAIRSHVAFIHAYVKASMPIALVVLAAGLHMTFAGRLWGSGWPVVSLVLFAAAGAAAGSVIDPLVSALKAEVDEAPEGPVTPELGAMLAAPRLTTAAWLMAGADVAIVYLMTNKPGWSGSLLVAALGLAFGAVMAARENRHAPAAPAA